MSKWLTHLKKFYLDKKKTDKSYSYKNAMKDAAKTYNSNATNSDTNRETCTSKSTKMRKLCSQKRRTQRKTRNTRK